MTDARIEVLPVWNQGGGRRKPRTKDFSGSVSVTIVEAL